MSVPTSTAMESESQKTLTATLRELCHFLTSFPHIQMTADDCEALAVAAVSGQAEAEFMVGSVYDAADEPGRAMEWYSRAAGRDYLPAMLQLFAVR